MREEHAQRPIKQEDVEGRGRGREEGRRESTAWVCHRRAARLRVGAAEVAARRPADDNLRVGADQRVRWVAVLEALDEAGAAVAFYARAVVALN